MILTPQAGLTTEVECAYCKAFFVPKVKWQKYCEDVCRSLSNQMRKDSGTRAKVASVSALANGGVSVTVRFPAEYRETALTLVPGAVVWVQK